MIKLTDVTIDPRSLGNKYWLVDIAPAYEYKNNVRTDTVTGYRYTVALPEKGLEKVNVKIEGKQQLDKPDGYVEVVFDDLEVYVYWSQGQPQIGARATGIHPVSAKS